MPVPPGMLWGCSILPPCLQRAQEGVCLMPLKLLFGGVLAWEILFSLADKGDLCRGTARLCRGGGARAPGGLVGPGRDAGRGGDQGCPAPGTPCTHPPPPQLILAATPPLPRIPPKTTPKPKSTSYIYTDLAPAPLLGMLFGGGVTVPCESPWGKARPFPQGHGVAVGTWTLAQCWGDNGAAPGPPANLRCLSQRRAATTTLAAAFVYGLNLY